VREILSLRVDGQRYIVRDADLWLLLDRQLREALCKVFLWMAGAF
jgi:hypothetical protein